MKDMKEFQTRMKLSELLMVTLLSLLSFSSPVLLTRPEPVVSIVVSKADLADLNQVSHKLVVEKTEKAVLGEPFQLSCSLPSTEEILLCSWSKDAGPEMFLQEGKLMDHRRREIEGISVDNKDTK